ncbi:hypothetical protein CDL12_27467 [Handroanthus impetiginosus]|uniref:Uncharacterized protein n=1 Tax=Handroanthus impetiginosus TaxID=429701 RepID=A0A2G9G4G4_9LAMI|nr:hypothetical protein CDL12_28325 [Handroanthus impetiginosus]PIN00035.1 hypothetical protein CDL12_27467 [Handroanthus impetiginosus]
MESSDTKLNRTNSPMKYEHETTAYANSNTHPPPAVEKIALHPSSKKLSPSSSRCSSSSPDSPLDSPFRHDDGNDDDEDDDDDKSISSASSDDHRAPVFASATEAPPNQSMERSASAYRIPSSVFARSKSNTPMEWSVASNESLFSIHTGNMSFTNDHFQWRSGDLGPPGEASTSEQMFSYPVHESASTVVADMRSRELGIAEATMKEVIKESEGQHYETSLAEVRNSRRSQGSNTSTKSFAFSGLTGETEKGDSMKVASSVRSSQEQTQSQSRPLMKPEQEQEPSTCPEPKTPAAATENAAQSKWFSCFSCCTFCS